MENFLPTKMPKKTDFVEIYARVQDEFDVEDRTQRKLADWLSKKPSSRQEALAKELSDEAEREMQIDRVTSEKSLRRIKTLSETSDVREKAETRLREFRTERENEYQDTLRSIFTMSESQIDALEIDREFYGNKLANSLERAVAQRRKEFEEE